MPSGLDNKLNRRGIETGIENARKSMERVEKMQEQYVADKQRYEVLFKYWSEVEGIDSDVRKEVLKGLREAIIEYQMSYNEQIEDKMQEQKEIIEDILIEAGEKLKKYDEAGKTTNAYDKFTSLGGKEIKKATDAAKTKAKTEQDELDRLSKEASADLKLRMEQNEMIRRQIMRDSFSGKN